MVSKVGNEHIAHLIGKDMDELVKMFPDAKACRIPTCEMNDIDHAIFMEYEQDIFNAEKQGKIRVMHKMNSATDKERVFYWHDGEKWIQLKQ